MHRYIVILLIVISQQGLADWVVPSERVSMRDIAALIDEPHSWIGKIETVERRLDNFEYVKYCETLCVKPEKGLKLLK